ncbi:MAG: hypothetical protein K6B38_10280, partial [Ruminococcus sp.]|nr:hypothetical protein [Ruminococcus sp.]
LRNVRKASLRLLYCFFRGTLSPSFTPCKGDNIPLDPRNAAFGGFYYFKKVKAVALCKKSAKRDLISSDISASLFFICSAVPYKP